MTGLRIAIVGAGIGGLTAALALEARGHAITVYERRTGFGETGAGIQLSPNASRVLQGFGIDASLRRVGTEPAAMIVRALRSGRPIASIGLDGAAACFGAPYLQIARSDLHTVLLDAVRGRPAIKLRVGRTLVSAEQNRACVRLAFESAGGNREPADADVAVGSDGLRSQMRVFAGDTREPVFAENVAFRATVPIDAVPPGFAAKGGLWLGRGRHVVHYPIGGGHALNIVAVAERRDPVEGWSAPADPAQVELAFAEAAEPLRRLLAQAQAWSAWSLYDLPVDAMAAGRIALLGDAAHPTLPFLAQGAALAIEDAAVLADALRGEDDVAAALQRYATLRTARVRRVQREARRNGRVYHAGGLLAFGRDQVMRRLGPAGMLTRYAWLYGWDAAGQGSR